ncbi:MAG: S-layer homology domain-containing protein [Firmicutes bacterium]|nr:S-layer homology domain-containing protein [Bacillota bacterium]
MTLYAKYEPIKCRIWFDTNGGEAVDSIEIQGDTKVSDIPKTSKFGYEFEGWYTDESLTIPFDDSKNVTSNMTLYAKWNLIIPDEAPEDALGFIDVNGNSWYYDDVNWVYKRKLMIEYNNAIFAPNNAVTTSNIVAVLAKLSGDDLSLYDNAPAVTGITEGVWYTNCAKWAIDKKIIDTFNPDEKLSRERISIIITRFFDYMNIDYDKTESKEYFSDDELISGEVKKSIYILRNLGIIFGRENDMIDPKSFMTRAEFAALVRRFEAIL